MPEIIVLVTQGKNAVFIKFDSEIQVPFLIRKDEIDFCHRYSWTERWSKAWSRILHKTDSEITSHIYSEKESSFDGPILYTPVFLPQDPITSHKLFGLIDFLLPSLCFNIQSIANAIGEPQIAKLKDQYHGLDAFASNDTQPSTQSKSDRVTRNFYDFHIENKTQFIGFFHEMFSSELNSSTTGICRSTKF